MLVTDMTRLQIADPIAKLEHIVSEAVSGGVNIVQLREKQSSHEQRIEIGKRLRYTIAGRALLFINSDIEAAIGLAADGLHLATNTDIADARQRIGDTMLISAAAHSVEDATRAEAAGADILHVGTVFASSTHPGGPTLGIDGLRAIIAAVSTPVIAIGGITMTNAADVMRAGAAGVAVISAILDADDPRAASEHLRAAIAAPVRA